MNVHHDITPIPAFIDNLALYDLDPEVSGTTPCQIIGISSYPGEALTFNVLIGHSLFSYIPPHLLYTSETPDKTFTLSELVYHNCPDSTITAVKITGLAKAPANVYLKAINTWVAAEYCFTVDWFNDNLLMHVLALSTGQFAAMPSHKVQFNGTSTKLPDYKKLHATWKV